MASKLLDKQRIPRLHAATIEAGLEGQRTALMQGIDANFVAGLPVSPAPSAQILTDLYGLNIVLADGSVPIGRWLENAALLASARPAFAVFEAGLAELGRSFPVPPAVAVTAIHQAIRRASVDGADVVILAAVQDELSAVCALDERGRSVRPYRQRETSSSLRTRSFASPTTTSSSRHVDAASTRMRARTLPLIRHRMSK